MFFKKNNLDLVSSSNVGKYSLSIKPSLSEIVVFSIITIVLLVVGNISYVSNLLGITEENQKDLGSFIGDTFAYLVDQIQTIPFSDTLVVFIINFIVALIVINAISYGYKEYKFLKANAANLNHTSTLDFIFKVGKDYLGHFFVGGFGIFWLVVFFLFLYPLGVKLSGLFADDYTDYVRILYLLFGYLVVMFGIIVWSIYLKVVFNNKWFSK